MRPSTFRDSPPRGRDSKGFCTGAVNARCGVDACMDVAEYLRRQKENLVEQAKLVKDFSVFEFDYIPDQPLMREEATRLMDEMLRFEISGIPTHHVLIGSRGSGKTLSVKFLQRIMPGQTALDVLYANCREHNTSFKILAHLLDVQARGASLAELFQEFCARHARKTVVILDEIDLMSQKDPRREILYLLSRAGQPFMVVALANNPHIVRSLDPATRSSLQPVPVHFRNYDAEQIGEILKDRAERGLVHWDEARLAEIAAMTVKRTNADARVAIKTLYYSITKPDGDLSACFERARRDVVVDMIHDLSDATLAILWAVRSAPTDFAKDIYARYCRFCQGRAEKPFSYVHFYSNLSYLQSVGLIALVSTKVAKTYANRVVLSFEEAVVDQICRLRFEQ